MRRARSELLAALTAAQPGLCGQQRTSSSRFRPLLFEVALLDQTHRLSLYRHAQPGMYVGPPPEYVPPLTMARRPNISMAPHRRSPGVGRHAIPTRESLSQWNSEREEAKMGLGDMHRADMKERVRRANELELEKEQALVDLEKKASGVTRKRARGCFGAMLRLCKISLE